MVGYQRNTHESGTWGYLAAHHLFYALFNPSLTLGYFESSSTILINTLVFQLFTPILLLVDGMTCIRAFSIVAVNN
jgi:hypothetical protein